jgi:hypothetical protein
VSFRLWSRFGYFPRFVGGLSALVSSSSLAPGLMCAFFVCACSSPSDAGSGGADLPGGACNVEPKTVTGLSHEHVSVCSEVDYPDNPPAGGNHYPVWAAFQSYSFPVPRGFWVHDLEHGAVVYSYNCSDSPDGCPDEVQQVQALIDALPTDSACPASAPRRVVLTPDPLLDVRWGVSAWGVTLRATCVDSDRFRQFYLNHFGFGLEDFCTPGDDFGGTPPCQ